MIQMRKRIANLSSAEAVNLDVIISNALIKSGFVMG